MSRPSLEEQEEQFILTGKECYDKYMRKLMDISRSLMVYDHIPGEIPETFRRDIEISNEIIKVMKYLKNNKDTLCKD
jgi:protein-arginine kinase activator protein McsA